MPGILEVRVNPVTGRVLVLHDPALSEAEIGGFIRDAVAAHQDSITRPVVPPRRRSPGTPLALFATGGGSVAMALIAAQPLVRLGVVLAGTAGAVCYAWRRSQPAARGGDDSRAGSDTSRAGSDTTAIVRNPLLRMVGRHRQRLYAASACSVLAQVMTTTFSMCIGWIGLVFFNGPAGLLLGLGLETAGVQLAFLAGAATVVYSVGSIFAYHAATLWRDLAQAVQHEWRHEMYSHALRIELRHLENERTTRIAQMLTADTEQFGRFLATSANDIVQLGTSFTVLLLAFTAFAPVIAWIVFLPVPLIVWMSVRHNTVSAPRHRTAMDSRSELMSRLINTLEAGTTVKSFGAEDYEARRIRELSAESRASNNRIDRAAATYNETVRAIVTASIGATLFGGGLAVTGGALAFESFYPLFMLPQQLLWRLPALSGNIGEYQRTVASLRRLLLLRELSVEPNGHGARLSPAAVRGELVFDEVTFAYPQRPPVLRNLSLRIAPGRVTAIVGASGLGKTTIAKLLLRLHEADAGRILLDGKDIGELNLADLRNTIAFVGQDAFLFDGTIAGNIGYGSRGADEDRITAAAKAAVADRFIENLPLRYETRTGERGVALSGGQKQRISLARAIVKDAPIMVLDEATSAVDNSTEADIARSLGELARGRTLIVIAHRLSTARRADRIVVLDNGGAVAEEGTHEQLVARGGPYAALWRLHLGEEHVSSLPGEDA
ncbi:ABC transporter ATP-binding protein [Nocardia sp. BMG51109]|uniref:ABC transporter ATP-binding protein n=1 Tax=Nocardia sp. BMG51109 TaxID=1056816 RepID=UPI00046699CE|nr:ABC transporter ATP-binding protein [Nocardia sp. BMG51109]